MSGGGGVCGGVSFTRQHGHDKFLEYQLIKRAKECEKGCVDGIRLGYHNTGLNTLLPVRPNSSVFYSGLMLS